MKIQRKYISRCIEIARNGLGNAAPNPSVGAVIVHKGNIIGEGFTSSYGGAHAEVNAINAVHDKELLKEATIYVTLEPCSHHGKTPPCADLILTKKIPKVVIGIQDPHKKVSGKGIEKLRAGGCTVEVGVLEKECRELHKRFITYHEQQRPYIILKWAETMDGFIAPLKKERTWEPSPVWITDTPARQLVHQWRSEEQAILVGTKTVLEDNPKLDARLWKGRHPIRIILDKDLRIAGDHHVMDGSIRTLVLTGVTTASRYIAGIDYGTLDFSKEIAQQICQILYDKQVTSVLIEGGGQTLQTFINAHLWDEARVFIGNRNFYNGLKAPELTGSVLDCKKVGPDILKRYRND